MALRSTKEDPAHEIDPDNLLVIPLTVSDKNDRKMVFVTALDKERNLVPISYQESGIIGEGSFGRVTLAFLSRADAEPLAVAIKTIRHVPGTQSRELCFLRSLDHRNVVKMLYSFLAKPPSGSKGMSLQHANLNFVLEFAPMTLGELIGCHAKARAGFPLLTVKLITHQLCRAVAYLHALGLCHRDVKPGNILIAEPSCAVKLCDIGSMKEMNASTPSGFYVSSRYYRAPELLLGAQYYSNAIDLWSVGCTVAELFLLRPLFPGSNTNDQLARIMCALGSPSSSTLQILSAELRYPELLSQQCCALDGLQPHQIMTESTPAEAVQFIFSMLSYIPSGRTRMAGALQHPFLAVLSALSTLPNGQPVPPLFDSKERSYLLVRESNV